MKTKNYLIILISFIVIMIFLFRICFRKNSMIQPLEISGEVLTKMEPIKIQDTAIIAYPVTLQLTNITDTIISFWTMTCTWEENWIFDLPSIHLVNLGCDSNYPIVIRLSPGELISYEGLVSIPESAFHSVSQTESILIGFIFIKESEVDKLYHFSEVIDRKIGIKEDIIWGIINIRKVASVE